MKFFRKLFFWLGILLLSMKGIDCCISKGPCYWTPFVIKTTPTFSEFSRHVAIEKKYQNIQCVRISIKKDNLSPNFRLKIVVDNAETPRDTVVMELCTYSSSQFCNDEGEVTDEISTGPNDIFYQWYVRGKQDFKGFTITFIPTEEVFKGDIMFETEYFEECYSW